MKENFPLKNSYQKFPLKNSYRKFNRKIAIENCL